MTKAIIWISAVVLLFMATGIVNAAKVHRAPLQISWSTSRGIICVYSVHAAPTDRVKVQLIAFGKDLGTDTKVWDGGIDSLLAVAERASTEAKGAHSTPAKNDGWRKLTIRYSKGGMHRRFSIEGELDELFRFFSNAVNLNALLKLASGDAPKAYRLIFENGPLRQTMRIP